MSEVSCIYKKWEIEKILNTLAKLRQNLDKSSSPQNIKALLTNGHYQKHDHSV